ncbi:MAG: NUDIX domain-containing protein [Ruminococcus bromii]|nr:NUDIX domain-containing protein [Ruminococcus bromii]MDD7647882.1 NUDIX domain-containing protein [Ruminococcus bromii]
MRIVILTCATGGGHLRAAAALEKYIKETTDHEVIQMDFLKSIGKLLDKTICDSYLFMAKKTPALFGRLYKTTNRDNPLADFVPRTTELIALQLYPHLEALAPDVIISVHPFATEMVSSLKEDKKITCPLICIMTDYGVHKAWIAPCVDAYVVACDDMVDELRRCGIPKEHIYPYGIPVHDVFFDKEDQAKLLQEMDLDTDVPTVLFMAGSMGVSNIVDLYRDLCASPLALQMIIITGNNKKLYELFSEEIQTSPKKTKLLQFTKEVERYMHASDLIVTKPGGLTVSEALACNLPLAVFDAIPGQEEDNANFLQTHDMGVRITSENFSAVISSLIEHKERLRCMRESCRAFDKSRANEHIVALAERLAKAFAAFNPDVSFSTRKGRFNYRTAAVIVQDGRLLVTTDSNSAYNYLPGGRVTVNETAEDALTRELREELNIEVAPGRALWVCQSFFTLEPTGERIHELCTYFAVDVSGTDLLKRGDRFPGEEPGVRFEWIPLDRLPEIDLEPEFLKTQVKNPPEHTELITVQG